MRKIWTSGLLLILFNGCLAGCVTELDKQLSLMRQESAGNEKLYGAACMKFVDVSDQMAVFKHQLQRMIVTEREKNWVLEHTRNGVVSASPEDFQAMLAKRDADAGQLALSQSVWSQTAGDFRRMIADKMAFSAQIYAREVDAQKAKESLQAATDSLLKAAIGAAGTAAIALPLLLP